MKGVLFGTAGVPVSSEYRDSISGISKVKEIGLDAMELEFVRGVRIGNETAEKTGLVAREKGIVLTAHAPYFINLASDDEKKVDASVERIVKTARISHVAGVWSVVFHAGFFQKLDSITARRRVETGIKRIKNILDDEGIGLWLRPETTGKKSQFSGIEDLIEISQGFERVMPCVDFAHLHARENGKFRVKEDFCSVLNLLERGLGKRALENMHMHMSGIDYTEKGERKHIALEESDIPWKSLIECLKERNISGVLISESPLIEFDALRMKDHYMKI